MSVIQFKAQQVEYNEAIDGEIVQISFDEDPNQDPFNRKKCYVMISQNYELPGRATVEWHDGSKEDGGATIQSYSITDSDFELTTNNGVIFKVQHEGNTNTVNRIKDFLNYESTH